MNKILVMSLLLLLFIPLAFSKEIVDQEINNDNSYLSTNFQKKPTQKEGRQLITNHKSFLVLNIIINGKNKQDNTTKE